VERREQKEQTLKCRLIQWRDVTKMAAITMVDVPFWDIEDIGYAPMQYPSRYDVIFGFLKPP